MDTKVKFSQMLGGDTQQNFERWTTLQDDLQFPISNYGSSAGDHMFEYRPPRIDSGGIWSLGDDLQIDPGAIGINQNQLTVGWGTTSRNTNVIDFEKLKSIGIDTDINGNPVLKESVQKLKNKVDKDLVDTKLPYNIKKDFNDNLIYEFAVAGYTECLTHKTKDGLKIILDDVKYDDLLGDEFEYLCKGMKGGRHEIPLFIDDDIYDTHNITKKMKYGVLTIFVPKLSKKSKNMETIVAEDD
jgi:hypothetical protein